MELTELADKFRRQQEFAAGYSPLSACVFGALADWLEEGDDTQLVNWLLEATSDTKAFDVTLLLLAGLHRDILDGVPAVDLLSHYYPTVGGNLPCRTAEFRSSLRKAIMARRHALANFIRTATVQTNETGRGLAWLLPLHHTGWDAVHLVELGASAGLNLVADRRAFRLVDESGGHLLDLGQGDQIQFLIQSRGEAGPSLANLSPLPTIASRTGCDIAPFVLATSRDELTLSAYVWGDQPQRLRHLREGIAALREINRSDVPVRLHAADLPDELPAFLTQHVAQPASNSSRRFPNRQVPVLIYNTYMTIYLKEKGVDLRTHIEAWAQEQTRPVLWLQWEPAWGGPEPPEFGWISWTADHWWQGDHRRWQFAWVQPHGTEIRWLPGIREWISFVRDSGAQ